MKKYNTYISEISKYKLYTIFELDDEDLIINKIKDLEFDISDHITTILSKSDNFLHKIYKLNNKIKLTTNTTSWDIVIDEKIINFYNRINKIEKLIKENKNEPKKLATIFHFTKNDIYDKISKHLTTIKDKGIFLLFYSSISNKHIDKVFSHVEKDEDYQKIHGYQKHSITKRLGDKYLIYFFKNITINQYIQSSVVININIIIDLLKKLNKDKFNKTLKRLVKNKKISIKDMNKMFISIKDRLDKDIANELFKIISNYREYFYDDMIIINILLDFDIDLLDIISTRQSNIIYSYKHNGAYTGYETYQNLINKVKYWDKTPIDYFVDNKYIMDILKRKFPEKYKEEFRKYNRKQKTKRFNL